MMNRAVERVMPPSYVTARKRKAKAPFSFPLDAAPEARQAFDVTRHVASARIAATVATALGLGPSLAAVARGQTVPQLVPIESRAHIRASDPIPLPFLIENANQRRVNCAIFFNFRDRPVWEGAAHLDPGERLPHTAQVDSRYFAFDSRPVRARIAAVVEVADERRSGPVEIVFAPLLPLQPQCRFRIRGQHRIDAPSNRSDLLAEVSIHSEGSSLRCRLLPGTAHAQASWEVLFLPLSPGSPAPEASHLAVRPDPGATYAIDEVSGPRTYARIESPPEAGDRRILDLIFPSGTSESISLQIILWERDGTTSAGYCPFASNLDQARDPAYAPELVPRATGPTHRAWVRPGRS